MVAKSPHRRAIAALGFAIALACGPFASAREVAWGTTPSAAAGERAEMFGVAADAADNAWAVGAFSAAEIPALLTQPYAQHWNGSAWTATPVVLAPRYASQSARLRGVSIVGTNDAWAVGHVDDVASLAARALAYRWNGNAWIRVPTPDASLRPASPIG